MRSRLALTGPLTGLILAGLCLTGSPARAEEDAAVRAPTRYGVTPFAMVAYQDETGFLLGAAAILYQRHPPGLGRRESTLTLAGAASLEGHLTLLVQPDLYLADDAVHLGVAASVARFPDLFYGIGEMAEGQPGEDYTPVYVDVEVSPKLRLLRGQRLYLGPSIRVAHTSIEEREADGFIDQRAVPGARGGWTVQAGGRAFWDARDDLLYPRRGAYVEASFAAADPAIGSDFSFTRARLDGRGYLPLPGPCCVLSLQAVAELRGGTPPFYELGELGGAKLLRGHYEGRYRDRQLAAAQAELRFPIAWRFGGVAFAGVGTVTDDVASAGDAELRAAGGVGLRFRPSRDPVHIRLDMAYGDELRFYLDIGEAF
jgi:Omp85 superfamily domain